MTNKIYVLVLVLTAGCGGPAFERELFQATGGAGGAGGSGGSGSAAGAAGGGAGAGAAGTAGAPQDAGQDACEVEWTVTPVDQGGSPWTSGEGHCLAKAHHCGVEPEPPTGFTQTGPSVCIQDDDTNKIKTFCKPCSGSECEACDW